MRGMLLFVVLVAAVARGDETPVRPTRFHPRCCEIVGTKFVTPQQLEAQLSWTPAFIKLCYGLDDQLTFPTEVKALLKQEYHKQGFWDVSVAITPQPRDRFRVEITEGPRFKRGPIEFVGAKQVDTKRLARWMGQIVPKVPPPIVLAVDDAKQPTLQRLPNGRLQRESTIDVASQFADADADQLAEKLQKLPVVATAAEPKPVPEITAAPPKRDLLAAEKLEPSAFDEAKSKFALPQHVISARTSESTPTTFQSVQKSDELPASQPLWIVNDNLPKHETNVPMLEKWLPLGFADQGFSRARFRVELIPQPSTATVLLKVVMLDEGPATQVQAIEITELRHNSRESILKHLNLNVGQRIDAARVQILEERLAETGRFLLHRITIGPVDDAGNATVFVDLRELPKGPALTDELSESQQLLLRAANELNRWSESQNDLVLSSHPSKDVPRDGSLGSLDWTTVITPERLFVKLQSLSADGTPGELWLMVGGGLLEFASSELRQRGKLKFVPCFETRFRACGEPDSPNGGTASLSFDWTYKSWEQTTHQFQFHNEPSVWLAKPIFELESLDASRTEFAFVPKGRGAISEKTIIDRGAGQGGEGGVGVSPAGAGQGGAARIVSHSIESDTGTLRLEPRRGAFVALLAESRLSAADFEDVTNKPFPEVQLGKLVLQALDGAGLKCPGLTRDQQTLAASVLKRLNVEHVGKTLLANSPPATSEFLLGAGYLPLLMHWVSSATQTTPTSGVTTGLRQWLALSQLASGMTLTDPVAADSGLAEQLRFEAIGMVGLADHSSVEVMTSRADFGPLAGLLGASGLLSKVQDPTRQFAANGIARLDQFAQERDALLTPGTTSHSLALLLVGLIRPSPSSTSERGRASNRDSSPAVGRRGWRSRSRETSRRRPQNDSRSECPAPLAMILDAQSLTTSHRRTPLALRRHGLRERVH